VVITVSAHVCAVYVPFLQVALHTVPLAWEDWGVMLLVALPLFVMMEIVKWLRMRRSMQ